MLRNTGLEEAQAGIKIAGRNINNLRYTDDTTRMAESEEELKLWGNEKRHSQSYGFSSGHVWMWELDCEESWALRIDAFEL